MSLRLYHNPRCSKSRALLGLLEERGAQVEVVEYLKTPPDRAELERLVAGVDDPPEALVRTKDARFSELGLDVAACERPASVVALLLEHPELMQRPVLVAGDRAAIGRPPEDALRLLD